MNESSIVTKCFVSLFGSHLFIGFIRNDFYYNTQYLDILIIGLLLV